jgi:hypothetical protein
MVDCERIMIAGHGIPLELMVMNKAVVCHERTRVMKTMKTGQG